MILDVTAEALHSALGCPPHESSRLRLDAPGGSVTRLTRNYAGTGRGGPVLLINSAGYLEVAVEGARADQRLGLHPGGVAQLTVLP